MKDRLTVEDLPEVVPPNTGTDRTEPMDEEENSKEGVPAINISAEYRWYQSMIEMAALGDSGEGGSFCISRRKVVEAGPNSLPDLQDVVRDAVMRGHGDQWRVEEFMALYPEKNVNKKMYQRISTPPDGFLRIIPFTGCYFGKGEFYNGVGIRHELSVPQQQT